MREATYWTVSTHGVWGGGGLKNWNTSISPKNPLFSSPGQKMDDIFLGVLVVRLNYHLRLVAPFLRRKTLMEPIWREKHDILGKMEIGEMCQWSKSRSEAEDEAYPGDQGLLVYSRRPTNPRQVLSTLQL